MGFPSETNMNPKEAEVRVGDTRVVQGTQNLGTHEEEWRGRRTGGL